MMHTSNASSEGSRGHPCDNTNDSSAVDLLASSLGDSGGVAAAGSSSLPPAHQRHTNSNDDGKRTQRDEASVLAIDSYTDDGDKVGDDGESAPTSEYYEQVRQEHHASWDQHYAELVEFQKSKTHDIVMKFACRGLNFRG